MKRNFSAPLLAMLLGVGACSPGTSSESTDDNAATCEDMLGNAGIDWLKERTGPDRLRMESDVDLAEARSLFYSQMRNWDPKNTKYFPFAHADMCLAKRKGVGEEFFTLRYTRSRGPLSRVTVQEGFTKTPVNADVALTHGNMPTVGDIYTVYIRCQIPGAPAEQKERLPVTGEIIDTLTGDTNARVHFTHLLHSAKVMADNLDCQNKPTIPAQPPASVK